MILSINLGPPHACTCMHMCAHAHVQKHMHTSMKREAGKRHHIFMPGLPLWGLTSGAARGVHTSCVSRYSLAKGLMGCRTLPTYLFSFPCKGQDQQTFSLPAPMCCRKEVRNQGPWCLLSSLISTCEIQGPSCFSACFEQSSENSGLPNEALCTLLIEPVLLKSWAKFVDVERTLS